MIKQTRGGDLSVVDQLVQPGNKLRIGYLSFDFRNHPMGHLTLGLLRDTDRSKFVVSAYQYGNDDKSKQRERLVAAADIFRDVRTMTDFHAAAIIAEPIDNGGDGVPLTFSYCVTAHFPYYKK